MNEEVRDLLVSKNMIEEEDAEVNKILNLPIPDTEKNQLVKARIGQGIFRTRVEEIESRCRMTGVSDKRFLVASHIKPWRASNNNERLDGNNGLLLSPHVDKLFDKGWISFSGAGRILCSNETIQTIMKAWGLDINKNVGVFTIEQEKYLEYHRINIYQSNS